METIRDRKAINITASDEKPLRKDDFIMLSGTRSQKSRNLRKIFLEQFK